MTSIPWARVLTPVVAIHLGAGCSSPDARDDRADVSLERIAQLEALGYVTGVEDPTREAGATLYDPAKTSEGLTFFSSSHAPEAYLIDVSGEVVHTWRLPYETAWPERRSTPATPATGATRTSPTTGASWPSSRGTA